MTIAAVEFIRRFLLHVLPTGFMKIRHYGFMANRFRGSKLALIRKLLEVAVEPPAETVSAPPAEANGKAETPGQVCRHCQQGRLHIVLRLLPARTPPASAITAFDTS
jgi:hypothetical protein